MLRFWTVLVVGWSLVLAACGEDEIQTVTVTVTSTGPGSVFATGGSIDCGELCIATPPRNSAIQLIATPDDNGVFVGWSGGGCDGTGTCEPSLLDDVAVEATFVVATRMLTAARSGAGSGTVTSMPAGIDCGDDCSEGFPHGTPVTLTATPDAGSHFMGWTGAGCSGTGPCMVGLAADSAATATFGLDDSLAVTKDGTGDGTVTSMPAGIDCGSDCDEQFAPNTQVMLTATPIGDATFTGWSGACTGTGSCVVTIDSAKLVTATFTQNRRVLTVAKAGNGVGTVASNVAGISCGADCSEPYDSGTSVVLTATPIASSTFTGWSGGGCMGTAPCTVLVTAATTITATFALKTYALNVVRSGMGTGTVSSNPVGISCGTDCTQTYNHGQIIRLTAAPSATSDFLGWTGGGCSGTAPCDVTLVAATTVTATFGVQNSLNVTKAGTGTGTVTSNPAGINCGTDCAQQYPANTMVTLTAAPIGDVTFAGWSGACTGTGSCVVTIDAAKMVTATFNLRRYTLTVTRAGNGAGSVISAPAGITCGTDCTEQYNSGTSVVLTATPTTGTTFTGWSGACTGTGTCTVSMTVARTVTATFTLDIHTLRVVRAGAAGTVTSNPIGINCGTDCSEAYNHGTMVQLTPTPIALTRFAGWSGACTGTGACVVTMDASKTVTATFAERGRYYTILESPAAGPQFQFIVPSTNAVTTVGGFGAPYASGDCAWNPSNGVLYALNGNGTGQDLYSVNVTTGAASTVGSHGRPDARALAYHPPSNAVYMIATVVGAPAAWRALYQLNLTTGAATFIGQLNNTTDVIAGMAWDSTRSRMIAMRGGTAVQFYSINMTTGVATALATPAGASGDNGITYNPNIDRFVMLDTNGALAHYHPTTFVRTDVVGSLGPHTCIAHRPLP